MRFNRNKGRNKDNIWLLVKCRELKVSPKEMAKIVGVSVQHWHKLLYQPDKLSMNDIMKIAARLNIPVRDILAWIFGVQAEKIGNSEKYWFE